LAADLQSSFRQFPIGWVCLGFSLGSRRGTEKMAGGSVSHEAAVEPIAAAQTCVEKLARLFPNASPVRLPVQVIALGSGQKHLEESTVIEFGTAHEVLFASTLPLEFEDRVRILNSDGSLDAGARVVALRYHDGRKAVATRFVGDVGNWIIKP
jgi:hypothetical protein